LQPDVMRELDAQERGAGGEIQLTDAMAKLIGKQPFHAYRFEGERYDCGSAAGFVSQGKRTVFGRYVVAIGTNEEAVRLSGIDPRPVKLAVFALSGLLAGLGGVFNAAYLESADPNAGIGMELSAIAAVVIGGTSLMGGRGSVVNSFSGVLIIAVLQTGLAQVGASEPMKRVITGTVIVAAVVADVYRHRLGWRRLIRSGRSA